MGEIPTEEHAAVHAVVRFLNTVIGKMSGVPSDAAEIAERNLLPITPASERAFLVEAFNRILISHIDFPQPFTRGIQVFQEKDDLLPFEEAKLYGHNATHALLAYIALALGKPLIADLQAVPGVIDFARAAFLEESGAALIQKYMASDPLFTPKGYTAYVDDLIGRMVNPYLRDTAERVGRDPARKLGWDDRLIGTMRLAWAHEVDMRRYAFGAAAALRQMPPSEARVQEQLAALWDDNAPAGAERDAMLKHVAAARVELTSWLNNGTPHLERWWGTSGI
jgi:mannitol-1-phosphate 5-dehydrogenase